MTDAFRPLAQQLLHFLAMRDTVAEADLIMGFGHFDLRIPETCAALYHAGHATRILFTGGIGAGTGDLGGPEAEAFRAVALDHGVPAEHIAIEPNSTNTAENMAFSLDVMAKMDPPLTPRSVLLVANPYRQRRVWLTARKYLPHAALHNAPPLTTLDREVAVFIAQGEDLQDLLLGEIDRLVRYGAAGWIVDEPLPEDLVEAFSAWTGRLPG